MEKRSQLKGKIERISMRHFVKFARNNDGSYHFEKSSGKEIHTLGLLFDQAGYPPDKRFVDWMEDLSKHSFRDSGTEIVFPQPDRETVVIRKTGEVSFAMPRNEYVKLFWLWYSVVMEKPEKIIVIWNGEISTIVQIDKEGKKLTWGEL